MKEESNNPILKEMYDELKESKARVKELEKSDVKKEYATRYLCGCCNKTWIVNQNKNDTKEYMCDACVVKTSRIK